MPSYNEELVRLAHLLGQHEKHMASVQDELEAASVSRPHPYLQEVYNANLSQIRKRILNTQDDIKQLVKRATLITNPIITNPCKLDDTSLIPSNSSKLKVTEINER